MGGWPTYLHLCSSFPIMERGCPILALFARVGHDAADTRIGAGSVRFAGAGGVRGKAHGAISLPPTLRKKPRRMGHPQLW